MDTREAILSGVLEATRLHDSIKSQKNMGSRSSIDVFSAIVDMKVPVLFRPLEGLLGACFSVPSLGIIISTQRPLSIQRFTGAHELGHLVMHHSSSLDGEEILGKSDDSELYEIQANAFASEFLMPMWLLSCHARMQGWDRESLKNPLIVYQFSLRLGVSYEALCYSLKQHKLIDVTTYNILKATTPKCIKQKLLPGYQPENWYRDVWLLTQKDEGVILEGGPNDIFRFDLNEKSGSGYLWNSDSLSRQGFEIVSDNRYPDEANIGGPVKRQLSVSTSLEVGELTLAHARPWEKTVPALETLQLGFDLRGKESGLPRVQRQSLHAA